MDIRRRPLAGELATGSINGMSRFAREVHRHLADSGSGFLGEAELRAWLADSVPFGSAVTCADANDAAEQADMIGYPVVLKVLALGVLHKTELGFIQLDLRSRQAVIRAGAVLLQRAQAAGVEDPQLSVQSQLTGIEMAVGVRRDVLGAVCLVAAGGTLIEIKHDAALAMAPVTPAAAADLIAQLRIAPALRGYRGSPAMDISALAKLVVWVSDLAIAVPELSELDLNPVFMSPSGCLVADAKAVVSPPEEPHVPRDFTDLSSLLSPRRIAIVGASSDSRKPGGLILHYLRKHGFAGDIVAVNRSGAPVEGVPTVSALTDITEHVDLACIAVPAAGVEDVVAQCVEKGVPSGIIYASGYAEEGQAGQEAQQRLLNIAGSRLRLLGPNSMGIVVPGRRICTSFGMALETDDLPAGPVAFVSQSGALASSLFSRSREYGIGFSHWISVGNEADLGMADFVAYLADDPSCKVICLFLEVIRQPDAFRAAAARARAAGKPIVVLKTGRSAPGRRAAASHTGALTGDDASYSAFFEQCGVLRVERLEDLFISAHGILAVATAVGRRVGILSMSGGACSIVADACIAAGLEVPTLSAQTQDRLRAIIPSFGGVQNPVDITATAIWNPRLTRESVSAVLADDGIDLALLQLGTNADPAATQMAHDLVELTRTASKPVLIGRLGSERLAPHATEIYREAGLHVYSWPEQLAQAALAACAAAVVR